MDYSLLVGIHDTSVGNTERIRDHQLQVIVVCWIVIFTHIF